MYKQLAQIAVESFDEGARKVFPSQPCSPDGHCATLGDGRSARKKRIARFALMSAMVLACSACGNRQDRGSVEGKHSAEEEALRAISIEYGADYAWMEGLTGASRLLRHLPTTDIERVWVTGRPIIFAGQLVDQVRVGEDHYELLLADPQLDLWAGATLRLRIRCAREIVDRARRDIPEIISNKFRREAAFIVTVERVVSTLLVDDSGAEYGGQALTNTRLGLGRCLAILPLRTPKQGSSSGER